MSVSLKLAHDLVTRALEAGAAQEVRVVVAVVDLGGHPVALARMDGTSYLNSDVAVRKAVLSAALAAPTHQIQTIIGKDPVAGPVLAADQRIAMLPGGYPVLVDGKCVGGLGIAGAHYLQDQAIAEYALSDCASSQEGR